MQPMLSGTADKMIRKDLAAQLRKRQIKLGHSSVARLSDEEIIASYTFELGWQEVEAITEKATNAEHWLKLIGGTKRHEIHFKKEK
jgi:hypothetical protein